MKVDQLESSFTEIKDTILNDDHKGRHSYPEIRTVEKEQNPPFMSEFKLVKKEHEERITLLEEKLAKSDHKLESLEEISLQKNEKTSIEGNPSSPNMNFGIKEVETLLNNTEIMQKYTLELKEEVPSICSLF